MRILTTRLAKSATFALTTWVAISSGSASPLRYGERSAKVARTALVAKIEDAVKRRALEVGASPLESDARLEAAAEAIARAVPIDVQPPNEIVQQALWLQGIVEPPPHLVIVAVPPGAEDNLIAELQKQLPSAFHEGHFQRVGVGTAIQRSEIQVVIALEESMIALDPILREVPIGTSLTVKGRLLGGVVHPELFVTTPDGQVQSIPLSREGQWGATYVCQKRGRHQVEITADDRFGPSVVANFPVYCGVPAPSKIEGTAQTIEAQTPFIDAAHAESEMLGMVNQDRARAGLPPIVLDERLSAVARAHSVDMETHGFVGHISPTTGNASDRVHRAGSPLADAQLILENVARAHSVAEAERGLMDSPGHRQNLLNREVTTLGVGIAASQSAMTETSSSEPRELLVTQLFIRPSEPFDAARTPLLLREKISELRRSQKLNVLEFDAKLDALASDAAGKIASGELTTASASAKLDGQLASFGEKYRSVRTLLAISPATEQVVSALATALSDPHAYALGLGVAEGLRLPSATSGVSSQKSAERDVGHALYVVLLLAQLRNQH